MQHGLRDHLQPHLGGAQRGRQLQQGGDQGRDGGPIAIQGLQIQNLQRRRLDRVALAQQGQRMAGDFAALASRQMQRAGSQVGVGKTPAHHGRAAVPDDASLVAQGGPEAGVGRGVRQVVQGCHLIGQPRRIDGPRGACRHQLFAQPTRRARLARHHGPKSPAVEAGGGVDDPRQLHGMGLRGPGLHAEPFVERAGAGVGVQGVTGEAAGLSDKGSHQLAATAPVVWRHDDGEACGPVKRALARPEALDEVAQKGPGPAVRAFDHPAGRRVERQARRIAFQPAPALMRPLRPPDVTVQPIHIGDVGGKKAADRHARQTPCLA
ncbi:hypothetical protein D3C71_759980 [compost metagenome]